MSDGHELCVTRFIAAPPGRVWDVMVNRQCADQLAAICEGEA